MRITPRVRGSLGDKIDKPCYEGAQWNPEELEPVEEWKSPKGWFQLIVEGGPEDAKKRQQQEQKG